MHRHPAPSSTQRDSNRLSSPLRVRSPLFHTESSGGLTPEIARMTMSTPPPLTLDGVNAKQPSPPKLCRQNHSMPELPMDTGEECDEAPWNGHLPIIGEGEPVHDDENHRRQGCASNSIASRKEFDHVPNKKHACMETPSCSHPVAASRPSAPVASVVDCDQTCAFCAAGVLLAVAPQPTRSPSTRTSFRLVKSQSCSPVVEQVDSDGFDSDVEEDQRAPLHHSSCHLPHRGSKRKECHGPPCLSDSFLTFAHSEKPVSCILASDMSRLLSKQQICSIRRLVIIDCRYPYEFIGGHIKGAMNWWEPHQVKTFFEHNKDDGHDTIVVFHCEFSENRGPTMGQYFRRLDRDAHGNEGYPNLYFPFVFVLYGGYKKFFKSYKSLCEPQAYVSMFDAQHRRPWLKYHRRVASM